MHLLLQELSVFYGPYQSYIRKCVVTWDASFSKFCFTVSFFKNSWSWFTVFSQNDRYREIRIVKVTSWLECTIAITYSLCWYVYNDATPWPVKEWWWSDRVEGVAWVVTWQTSKLCVAAVSSVFSHHPVRLTLLRLAFTCCEVWCYHSWYCILLFLPCRKSFIERVRVLLHVWTVMAATNMPVHGWKIIETTIFLEHKKASCEIHHQ